MVFHDGLCSSFYSVSKSIFFLPNMLERTKVIKRVPTVEMNPLQYRFSIWSSLGVVGRERKEKERGLERRNTQNSPTIFRNKRGELQRKTVLIFLIPVLSQSVPNFITNTSKQNNKRKIKILLYQVKRITPNILAYIFQTFFYAHV